MLRSTEKNKLVFPELSYSIIGASFRVFNELGWGLQEKYYQKALAQEFDNLKVPYAREFFMPLRYKDDNLGRYFADFIIGGRILIEFKVVNRLGYVHCKQVLDYLKQGNLKLGILIYLRKTVLNIGEF